MPEQITEPNEDQTTQTLRVQLNYPPDRVYQPILAQLVTDYDLIPNIRRADYDERNGGFIFLELTGGRASLRRALVFLDAMSIEVNALPQDGESWVI